MESVFGIRFIKTARAKIITGICMLLLVPVDYTVLGSDIRDQDFLLMFLLLVGGIWYLYKGIHQKQNDHD